MLLFHLTTTVKQECYSHISQLFIFASSTIRQKKQLLVWWPLWLYYPWITHSCCKIPSITLKNSSLLARTSPWPQCLYPLGVMPNHQSFATENLWCSRDLRTKPLQTSSVERCTAALQKRYQSVQCILRKKILCLAEVSEPTGCKWHCLDQFSICR